MLDFDGTLVDSEGFWRQSAIRLLCEKGIEIPECLLDPSELFFRAGLRMIDKDAPTAAALGMTYREREEWAFENMRKLYLTSVKLKPGAEELVQAVGDSVEHVAVVTASRKEDVSRALAHFGLDGRLTEVFTAGDDPYAKKKPQIYQDVFRHFGVTADSAMLIDDSYEALAAAKQAGTAYCWAVFDRSKAHRREKTAGVSDAYFETLGDLAAAFKSID